MRTRRACCLVAGTALVIAGCDASRPPEPRPSLLETLAGADTAGYARARAARAFDFPTDHGPHPEFRTEWWYVTGNLRADGPAGERRDFGFQLTIFRSALAPTPPASTSAWATNQAYMAHFTVTDVTSERFRAFERFARGAAGVAGATAEPLRVWLEDWEMAGTSASGLPLRLHAADEGVALELTLEEGKPAVAHGEDGLSQKGPEPGNASFYYSFTRMPAEGTLVLDGDSLRVSGLAWLDREWSTSALSEDLVGWDWLALQLDDGWDLMLYRLRRADESAAPWSGGTLVAPDGISTPLIWGEDVTMASSGTWTSPIDGAVYPAGWRVALPERGWSLTVEPRIPDQELDLAFRYWEGAVSVTGSGEGGAAVRGRGYVELTGYAGERPER